MAEEAEEVFLYDPDVISKVDLTKSKCNFNPPVFSATDPGPGIRLRPLSIKDYDRGNIFTFTNLLLLLKLLTCFFNNFFRISRHSWTVNHCWGHFKGAVSR